MDVTGNAWGGSSHRKFWGDLHSILLYFPRVLSYYNGMSFIGVWTCNPQICPWALILRNDESKWDKKSEVRPSIQQCQSALKSGGRGSRFENWGLWILVWKLGVVNFGLKTGGRGSWKFNRQRRVAQDLLLKGQLSGKCPHFIFLYIIGYSNISRRSHDPASQNLGYCDSSTPRIDAYATIHACWAQSLVNVAQSTSKLMWSIGICCFPTGCLLGFYYYCCDD